MIQRLCNHTAVLVVGIAVGAVLTAAWHGVSSTPNAFAVATHGSDNFAIATGLVDDGIEALYFLDYLTGDLRAAVVSRRNGEFTGFFQYNVMADFSAIADAPKFLMVTGQANIPRGRGPTQIGHSLVYVAEATSGQVFAYAVPYNSTLNSSGKSQVGGFIRVGGGSFRDAFVRDALNHADRRTMEITVNGVPRQVEAGATVATLVDELGLDPRRLAVERNLELVPRGEHAATELATGDRLEVVTLVGGG